MTGCWRGLSWVKQLTAGWPQTFQPSITLSFQQVRKNLWFIMTNGNLPGKQRRLNANRPCGHWQKCLELQITFCPRHCRESWHPSSPGWRTERTVIMRKLSACLPGQQLHSNLVNEGAHLHCPSEQVSEGCAQSEDFLQDKSRVRSLPLTRVKKKRRKTVPWQTILSRVELEIPRSFKTSWSTRQSNVECAMRGR